MRAYSAVGIQAERPVFPTAGRGEPGVPADAATNRCRWAPRCPGPGFWPVRTSPYPGQPRTTVVNEDRSRPRRHVVALRPYCRRAADPGTAGRSPLCGTTVWPGRGLTLLSRGLICWAVAQTGLPTRRTQDWLTVCSCPPGLTTPEHRIQTIRHGLRGPVPSPPHRWMPRRNRAVPHPMWKPRQVSPGGALQPTAANSSRPRIQPWVGVQTHQWAICTSRQLQGIFESGTHSPDPSEAGRNHLPASLDEDARIAEPFTDRKVLLAQNSLNLQCQASLAGPSRNGIEIERLIVAEVWARLTCRLNSQSSQRRENFFSLRSPEEPAAGRGAVSQI